MDGASAQSLAERAPHVEDRGEKGEYWVCDGETWGDYRGERWFARNNRTRLALDRGGVGEAHRPTTTEKRLTDMDRDGVEASLMFPPIIAMQVGDAELRNACVRGYNDWALDFGKTAPKRFFPSPCCPRSMPKRRETKSSAWPSWGSAKPIFWSTT